jgi:hypothetical protein
MYFLTKVIKGYRPLACADGRVVLSKGGNLYLADLDLLNIKFLCSLPRTSALHRLPRIRLFERIFRLSISYFLVLDSNWGLAVRRGEIWRVNLKDGSVSLDFLVPKARKILSLSLVKGLDGFDDSVVFGEYFNNPSMQSVNVWHCPLTSLGSWSICYTFPAGRINHIHNIVMDTKLSSLWILAGDFDEAAQICLAHNNFGVIDVILRGNQQSRATWIHRLNDKAFYATDSQLEANCICVLDESNEFITTKRLDGIEGSSIYFVTGKSEVFFSTAVEPGLPTGNIFVDLFTTKIGKGINSRQSVIYELNPDGKSKVLFRAEKDLWPMNLAQFGTFTFPSGVMPDQRFYAYGCALKDFDDSCMLFVRNNSQ